MPGAVAAFCAAPPLPRRVGAAGIARGRRVVRAAHTLPAAFVSRRAALILLAGAAASPLCDAARADGGTVEFSTLPSGLVVQDLRLGRGAQPVDGNEVVLCWTGRLAGRYGWPFQGEDAAESRYILGRDALIAGFEEGMRGMHEGGKRRMLIPPSLGYVTGRENPRPAGFGDRRRLESTVANSRRIAGAGTVVIDVELIRVRAARAR